MEIATNAAATVGVMNGTTLTPSYPVWIQPSAPQAFPTVLNQDGSINAQANPAKSGSIVTFYATGWQSLFPGLTDGQIATAAWNLCPGVCQASDPGFPITATVLYGGAAPGIVAGVTQFNVQIFYSSSSAGAFNQAVLTLTNPTVTETVWITP
jgi:uncharacterized protein (TIGR03437 family)